MGTRPSYYAVLTAEVRYDKNLSASEKLFYAEITALTQMNGSCYASNAYFAELYGVARSTISLWVSNLVKAGYISVEMQVEGGQVVGRSITLTCPEGGQISEGVVRKSEGGGQKTGRGWSENQKGNNTLTESNTTPTESNTIARSKFSPPSVDDVFSVMADRKQSEMFVAFYESKGWKVGRTPMKDWRAAVRGWMTRNNMKPNQALYGDTL